MPSGNIKNKIAIMREGKLTKSQRKLLDYFETVDHKRVIYMSITDLASATGVAEATVLRFCRFNGYQEFRLNLAQGVIDIGRHDQEGIDFVEDIADTYKEAMDNCRKIMKGDRLQTAFDMIFGAETICCFGVGHSYLAALELHNRLMMMGILTHCERDTHLQNVLISSRSEKDLMIIFRVSGSSKDTLEAAELARACGMKVIVITSYEKSPLTRYADLVLAAAPMEAPNQPGAMTGKIMQLFMVDILCTGLHLSDKTRFDSFVARSNRATVGKLI